jgi:hypothetical protein
MKRTPLIVCALAASALADPTPVKKPPASGGGGGYSGLGAESITPEVIAKYAAPALDPSVSRRIQAMLDIRGSGGGVLNSRGDKMFFTTRITGTTRCGVRTGRCATRCSSPAARIARR